MLYQSTCVGFGYGLCGGYFPEAADCTTNPVRRYNPQASSHLHWPRTINLVPIDYGFRPRLRGRLTLRGLALRRNPWTFGAGVSHTRLATHVSILTSDTSSGPHGSAFTGLRNAPLPRNLAIASAASVHGLSPVTFSARDG